MVPALERHDALLRRAVEDAGGVVVKTTGDGLHGVFTTTRAALDAALAAQRSLGAEAWAVPGGLRVRMGLHTGDAVARDGDYYGPATNRAARVMSSAHGGQVVVSHATEEILRDALPDELALVDLGEHRLPDLARPERIFQVVAPGLGREFPPLRALDAVPGNLPGQLTSFVGRAVEREAIADALLASRLVTVTGVGGVGKSRIAIQVALDIAARFPDGAWLCELAAAQDEEELGQVVAATLGVLARPATTLADSVIDALRMRELVLVLDNCEHLVAAVGHLAEGLLRDCPGVRILATSREALGIAGEQVWPLSALGAAGAHGRRRRGHGQRGGAAVRRTGPRGAAGVRARRIERRGHRRDLPPARRHPARGRARRGTGDDHDAGRHRGRASTNASSCSPAVVAARPSAIRRCAARSSGRTSCSKHASGRCSSG